MLQESNPRPAAQPAPASAEVLEGGAEGARSLKVLIVGQPVDGGVAVAVAQLAAAGVAAGHEVTVACPDPQLGNLADRIVAAGARHVAVFGRSRLPSVRDLRDLLVLRRLAKDHDVVHLHSSKAGAVGRLATRTLRTRPPIAFTPHAWSWLVGGKTAGLFRLVERALAGSADVVIAVSDDEAQQGARILGDKARLLRVIHNGVDRTHFTPDGPLAPREDSTPLIVCVGRLSRQKGQDVAIRALARLANPRAVLRLVGDGPDRPELAALADELGVADRVEFAGVKTDTAPELRAADVVIAPSRWDGLSLVLLEAMACGATVVATRVSGSEALEGAGVIIEPDDSSALAEAIDSLLAEPERCKQLGDDAHERSRSFDLASNLARNLGVWAELAARH